MKRMKKINSAPLKWLAAKSRGQRFNLALLIFSNAFFSVLSVAFAFAVKAIINGATDGKKQELIYGAAAIVAIVLLQFVFRIVINGLAEHIRGKLEIAYKSHIFSEILNKKYDKINTYHSGELLNRLSSDVAIVADGVTGIVPSVVAAVVRLVCAVIALVTIDAVFAAAFVVCGALVFATVALLRGKLKSLHKTAQETDGKVRSFMQESIENVLAVKVFSVNDKICAKSDELQKENFRIKMRRKNYSVTGHAVYNFIFSAGYLFALIYGAARIYGSELSYGALSAILQLVNNVQVPFASLSSVFPKFYAMIASAERLMEIESLENESGARLENPVGVYEKTRAIRGENISFSYGRTPVFANADFEINKGEFVVITGVSGIGKSTLVKMLLGVYAPNSGELYIDLGESGKIPADASARSLFSYVPQGNMLFSGTLRDNVTFVNSDASETEIAAALKASCSEDFVNSLPDGLETEVGENGIGLSEGQIQRIAIARALLTGAHVLILDEATSALDEKTEEAVLNNLKGLRDITLILISHKKAAFGICDKEITVKKGKIVTSIIKNIG